MNLLLAEGAMFWGVIYLYKVRNKIQTGNETYLLRGMCSNGPDVGIVPHKSLLETSLKEQGG